MGHTKGQCIEEFCKQHCVDMVVADDILGLSDLVSDLPSGGLLVKWTFGEELIRDELYSPDEWSDE